MSKSAMKSKALITTMCFFACGLVGNKIQKEMAFGNFDPANVTEIPTDANIMAAASSVSEAGENQEVKMGRQGGGVYTMRQADFQH